MDPAANPAKSSESRSTPSELLTWPISVQLALGFLVIACLFFMLGRWTHPNSNPQIEMTPAQERAGPAIDLNFATKAELRLIPGIGDALAQRIVEYRTNVGPFRSIDDLRKVSGIGPKTLDRLRHCLFVTSEESFVSDDDSEPMSSASKPKSSPRASTVSKKVAELSRPINVNVASQTELQKLPGIGPKLSQRILDERTKSAFKSVDDLRRVPGIGPKTLEKLRPHVTIEST